MERNRRTTNLRFADTDMFSIADILFKDSRTDEELLLFFERDLADSLPFRVSRIEWRGYSTIIPQILVETSPVPLTLQVEGDPSYVSDEIEELTENLQERLTADDAKALRACDTLVSVMSANSPRVEETNEAIRVYASSDLNPVHPEVSLVLHRVAELTDGWLIDNVEGRIRRAGTSEWLKL